MTKAPVIVLVAWLCATVLGSDRKASVPEASSSPDYSIGVALMVSEEARKIVAKENPVLAKTVPVTGLYVVDVLRGSPADKAKVISGDVLLSVNGQTAKDVTNLNLKAGTNIVLLQRSQQDGARVTWKRMAIKVEACRSTELFRSAATTLRDDVQNLTIYSPPQPPTFRLPGRWAGAVPHLTLSDAGDFKLAMEFRYVGNDWLFFDAITFGDAKSKWKLDVSPAAVSRKVVNRGVSEVAYHPMTRKTLGEIAAHSPDLLIRFSGKDGIYDVALSDDERAAFGFMIKLYDEILASKSAVERQPSKLNVASSNLVARFDIKISPHAI